MPGGGPGCCLWSPWRPPRAIFGTHHEDRGPLAENSSPQSQEASEEATRGPKWSPEGPKRAPEGPKSAFKRQTSAQFL
eukprot:2089794-Pyramimonas_sp.AAC.1